jgi:hypothetical protein
VLGCCNNTVSISGEDCLPTISISGYQMLGAHKSVRRCKTLATVVYIVNRAVDNNYCQNLAIGNRGPGGQLSVARPPGCVSGAPQAPHKITGSSNTR